LEYGNSQYTGQLKMRDQTAAAKKAGPTSKLLQTFYVMFRTALY